MPTPAAVIAWSATAAVHALAPHVSPRRVARLREVASRRLADTVLLLENLSDARNLSACLRTADALGVHHVAIVERWGPAGPAPGAASVSGSSFVASVDKGAAKWLACRRFATVSEAVRHVRGELGAAIYATALAPDALPLSAAVRSSLGTAAPGQPRPRVCLAFGSEHRGVSQELRALADASLYVPQAGFVESMNVSVAVGVVLSAFARRTADYEAGLVAGRGGGLVARAAAELLHPDTVARSGTVSSKSVAAAAAEEAATASVAGPVTEHLGVDEQAQLLLTMLLTAVPNAEKILERKGLRPLDL